MENFIHEQNIAMFKRLSAEEPDMDQKRRKMISKTAHRARRKTSNIAALHSSLLTFKLIPSCKIWRPESNAAGSTPHF